MGKVNSKNRYKFEEVLQDKINIQRRKSYSKLEHDDYDDGRDSTTDRTTNRKKIRSRSLVKRGKFYEPLTYLLQAKPESLYEWFLTAWIKIKKKHYRKLDESCDALSFIELENDETSVESNVAQFVENCESTEKDYRENSSVAENQYRMTHHCKSFVVDDTVGNQTLSKLNRHLSDNEGILQAVKLQVNQGLTNPLYYDSD